MFYKNTISLRVRLLGTEEYLGGLNNGLILLTLQNSLIYWGRRSIPTDYSSVIFAADRREAILNAPVYPSTPFPSGYSTILLK